MPRWPLTISTATTSSSKNDTKGTFTRLLLSLAFQMAQVNPEARRLFLGMIDSRDEVNTQDHIAIWSSLFLTRLFKIPFSQPLCWVMDALDECPKKPLTSLIQRFAKIGKVIPLRIFFWAALTVARLDELYSVEDIEAAIEEVPTQMHEFYASILETIKASPNADKAECILKWVVCAPSPMMVEELRDGILLDSGHPLLYSSSGDIFSEMCGSLVASGPDSRVRLMHQTAREFLTSRQSKFYISTQRSHQHISNICLQHLNSKSFSRHSFRRPKAQGNRRTAAATPAFAEHASAHFSYHLRHSHSTALDLLLSIVAFAKSKSLV